MVQDGKLFLKISPGNTQNQTSGITIGYGAKVMSNTKILYGSLNARIKSARVGGVVSAFVLMSNEKDEVDWEWVGKDEHSSQTNYYYRGELDYTKGVYIPNSYNTYQEFHDYGINWTQDELSWLIDGKVVRTVKKSETGEKFPNTPTNIYFSIWDGGASAAGTRDWAGGQINWQDSEIVKNGYIAMEVESITYSC
ncbi:concanavalin A-like lectin/glucanase [Neoconidiobolus thromboides FSU 785]|nr:concanavalin A-like lectin/glucanase [Neoconidiobolus thromboides FSU 785]